MPVNYSIFSIVLFSQWICVIPAWDNYGYNSFLSIHCKTWTELKQIESYSKYCSLEKGSELIYAWFGSAGNTSADTSVVLS